MLIAEHIEKVMKYTCDPHGLCILTCLQIPVLYFYTT